MWTTKLPSLSLGPVIFKIPSLSTTNAKSLTSTLGTYLLTVKVALTTAGYQASSPAYKTMISYSTSFVFSTLTWTTVFGTAKSWPFFLNIAFPNWLNKFFLFLNAEFGFDQYFVLIGSYPYQIEITVSGSYPITHASFNASLPNPYLYLICAV